MLLINDKRPNHLTWVSQTKLILEQCGLGYSWRNQAVDNEAHFLRLFKRRLMDIFFQEWSSEVSLTSENRVFKHIKNEFKFEPYLTLNNKSLRIAIKKN